MCDKEDKKMHATKKNKSVDSDTLQKGLESISSSINVSKLIKKDSLPLDSNGRVKIDSSHPDYKYWTKDDE